MTDSLIEIVDRYQEETTKFVQGNTMSYLLFMNLFDYYFDHHIIPYNVAEGEFVSARKWVETRFLEYMVKYYEADRKLNRPGLFK